MENRTAGQVTADDKEFLSVLNHAAYEDVVRRRFGQWDEAWQRRHFEVKWAPEILSALHWIVRRQEICG